MVWTSAFAGGATTLAGLESASEEQATSGRAAAMVAMPSSTGASRRRRDLMGELPHLVSAGPARRPTQLECARNVALSQAFSAEKSEVGASTREQHAGRP